MPTATLTLTSADIAGDPVSVSQTSTCYKAGSGSELLDQSYGLTKIILTTGSANIVLPSNHTLGTEKAAKVYICNKSDVSDEYITVTINSQVVGRLYAGQWCFFPWTQLDANSDIKVTAYSAGKSIPVEYMLMHEGYEFS
tara:strand:- start:189 stop:608 length:420 start_codon:yes stop_codon:yes gene_type:complete